MEKLIDSNILTRESIKNTVESYIAWLNKALKDSVNDISTAQSVYLAGRWTGMKQAEANITQWDTGVDIDLLKFVGQKSVQIPANLVRMHKYISWNRVRP